MNLGSRHNQKSFAQVPQLNMARSNFNRSFTVKDTMDFDYLNPIYCEEIIPGDTIRLNVHSFFRLATQEFPLMDNAYVDFFFFFVPNRLLWSNWERFMGAQDDPGDSIDYVIPCLNTTANPQFEVGTIYDKFDLPTNVPTVTPANGGRISSLPFRAYNLIYNEWFRDQNLQNSVIKNTGDGPDTLTDYALLRRAKLHDYFTSCLPSPQKGAQAVTMDVTGTAPVTLASGLSNPQVIMNRSDTGVPIATGQVWTTGGAGQIRSSTIGQDMYIDPNGTLIADGFTGNFRFSITDFREAMALQSFLERDARGGTRYVEILKSRYNVVSPDFRLQRPEFLGKGSTRIVQHVVPQNSETGTTPQANLAAYSTAATMGGQIGFTKSFVEHGYVIGLCQARGEVTYQQGLDRKFTRSTRYDFFAPEFQQLSEQAVLNQEIVYRGSAGGVTNFDVFGYQERYAEYRYSPSRIRGQFRSTFAQSLDAWHLAEELDQGNEPNLNAAFIVANTPIERNIVVAADYPHLLVDLHFDINHARPMMTYGVPASLGRF